MRKKIVFFIPLLFLLFSCQNNKFYFNVRNISTLNNEDRIEVEYKTQTINIFDYIDTNYDLEIYNNDKKINDVKKIPLDIGNNKLIIDYAKQTLVLDFYRLKMIDVKIYSADNSFATCQFEEKTILTREDIIKCIKEIPGYDITSFNIDFPFVLTDDLQISPTFTPKLYNLSFYDDNLKLDLSYQIKEGDLLESLPIYEKTGYQFTGWLLNNELVTENTVYTITKGTSLIASFILNSYELFFYIDNIMIKSVMVKEGECIKDLPLATKTGYTFTGWYDDDSKLVENDIYTCTKYNNKFYAKFSTNKYYISYSNIDAPFNIEVYYDDNINLYIPKKEGYIFKYWKLDNSIFSDSVYKFDHDITLIAVFEENNITINLNIYGEEVAKECKIDDKGYIINPTIEKEGYILNGIYWDSNFADEFINVLASDYNDEILYAKLTIDDKDLQCAFNFTRFNSMTEEYNELYLFDAKTSIPASLYWHKIGIVKQNESFVVSGIAKAGVSKSTLGNYDYILLAYPNYSSYEAFQSANIKVNDKVEFYNNPSTMQSGSVFNLISFIKADDIDLAEVTKYLDNMYGSIVSVTDNINLVSNALNYSLNWKTSNPRTVDILGNVSRGATDQIVTLSAYINNEMVYEFTFIVLKGDTTNRKLSTGYIYTGYSGLTDNALSKLDILYCSFLYVDSNGNFTNKESIMSTIKNNILNRKNNFKTKIIVSINQKNDDFSIVAASSELRKNLAQNLLELVREYNLDGIDIDWETPKTTEKENFTLFAKEIYETLKAENSDYLLTAAIGGGKWAPPKYDLPNSVNYLDYINLMTYSMTSENGYYQNALYKSTKKRTLVSCSIDESIKIYNDLGVTNDKILVGIPFYAVIQSSCSGPGTLTGKGKSLWYKDMLEKYAVSGTMKEYYDEECGVPYRFDEKNQIFISYDNERSIKDKCDYLYTKNLAGMMFWQYGQDVDDYLINSIAKYI